MRGKISDQDLTDYALNALEPEDRLYVESMLAVSEECRNDICELIDLGQMIQEGFEAEAGPEIPELTAEQRAALVNVKTPFPIRVLIQRATTIASIAACVAFALINYDRWEGEGNAMATVSSQVSKAVAQVVSTPQTTAALSQSLVNIRSFVEDSATWVPDTAMICTPPSFADNDTVASVNMSGVSDMY